MTGKKIDFSMTLNGQSDTVKARIWEGENGHTFARLDGGIFCGFDINLRDLDLAIAILQQVRQEAGKGAYAQST